MYLRIIFRDENFSKIYSNNFTRKLISKFVDTTLQNGLKIAGK